MPLREINCELCELVGAVIGNGNLWTDGSRYRVELTGDPKLDVEYFRYLSAIANSLFKKKPYPMRIRQRGLRWRLQSKDAFSLLLELGVPSGKGKSHKVAIPECVLQKGWSFAKLTVRGIMDTDGTLFFSKKTYAETIYPTIELRTCSPKLAHQLDRLLSQHDFRVRTRGNENVGFHVALYGIGMLRKWITEIGFSNPKHVNKLQLRKL
jgi:hypothetical protein